MKKLLKNRRGQEETSAAKIIKYVIAVIVLGIGAAIFSLSMVDVQLAGSTADPSVRLAAAEHRLLYSPDCLAYQDPLTGRTEAGVIDLRRFDDATLSSCFATQDKDVCLRLELAAGEEPLGAAMTQNYGACAVRHDMVTDTRYVLVRDAGRERQGVLRITKPKMR